MRSISFWIASRSSACSGRLRNNPMRRSSATNASRNARCISSGSALNRRRIGNAPMRRHGLARPERADFLGGVVAYREHEVHLRRARLRELVPAFAARVGSRKVRRLQFTQRLRPHLARRMTARAVGLEARLAPVIQDGFRHDRARRISRAQKQHVVDVFHKVLIFSSYLRPCSLMEATAAAASRTSASGFFSDATDTVDPQHELPFALASPSGASIVTRSQPCAMRGC